MGPRAAGILLHPTSLPGPHGIGELGPEATAFLDFLAETGQGLWQVLPLGPTGYGDSPYQCFSAFAGNPLLVSLDRLRDEGLLSPADLKKRPDFPEREVDFGAVIEWKAPLLARACAAFEKKAAPARREALEAFVKGHAAWLDDFALFMALKRANGGAAWSSWDRALVNREEGALARARQELAREVREVAFEQWLFFEQWGEVRRQARERGIRIMGDIPIFVAQDSADVWANPSLFHLAADGRPSLQAGVPPDYFSATGQLWGNPLYRWDALARTGYAWWIDRFRAVLRARGPGAARPLPRLRGLLGGAGGRDDRGGRALGQGAGGALLRGAAQRARRPADRGRGPGRHHPRGRGAARRLLLPGDGDPAVRLRLRRARQRLPAPQLPEEQGRLHRDPRQRHGRGLVDGGGGGLDADGRGGRDGAGRAPSPTAAATGARSTGTSSGRSSSPSPTPRSCPCRTCWGWGARRA